MDSGEVPGGEQQLGLRQAVASGFAPRIFLLPFSVSYISPAHKGYSFICSCNTWRFVSLCLFFLPLKPNYSCAMNINSGAVPDAWEDSWENQADV